LQKRQVIRPGGGEEPVSVLRLTTFENNVGRKFFWNRNKPDTGMTPMKCCPRPRTRAPGSVCKTGTGAGCKKIPCMTLHKESGTVTSRSLAFVKYSGLPGTPERTVKNSVPEKRSDGCLTKTPQTNGRNEQGIHFKIPLESYRCVIVADVSTITLGRLCKTAIFL
jgi:hypothetical protein